MVQIVPTFSFHTFGCKLNFAESSHLAGKFKTAGYLQNQFEQVSDIYVLNTCAVTENAAKECERYIRSIRKRAPDAIVAIIGCQAQLKPETLRALEGVDLVLSAKEKFNVLDHIKNLKNAISGPIDCGIQLPYNFEPADSQCERTRAFLKVQDGCDYSCSFCTIPLARGRSRSDTIENVLLRARNLAAKGIKEIVLTGVNTGDFGLTLDSAQNQIRNQTFLQLLMKLDKLEEAVRFRISSVEPNLLHPEIIEFIAESKRFAPHFHIPLQSGSNAILAKMRRRYKRELYAERVSHIVSKIPHAGIGMDVISGFPGETESHFSESLKFIHSLPISYIHAFTYSERPDTDAILMEGKIPQEVRKERTQILRSVSDQKQAEFLKKNEGEIRTVIFESGDDKGNISGYTENYIKITLPFSEKWVNREIQVRMGGNTRKAEICATQDQLSSILL